MISCPERQETMNSMTADGQAIADSMYAAGLQEQIIKAQLIYFSYFEIGQIVDFSGYAEMFRNQNDESLISDINNFYGLEISYEDFMRSYVMVMNLLNKEHTATEFIAPQLATMTEGIVKGSEQRLSRAMFKIAVELGAVTHMLAALNEIDDETLFKLRMMCTDEVKRINGIINFEKAVRYQRSSD